MGEDKLDEEIKPDKEGKFPETVSWSQYVKTKETIGNKLDKATEKIAGLEEQLKRAVNPEEFTKTKEELDRIKSDHQQVVNELKTIKDKSVGEKKEFLKSRGIPEEELADATEKDLDILAKAMGNIKPKADLGGGGGSGELPKDPMALFRMAKSKTK